MSIVIIIIIVLVVVLFLFCLFVVYTEQLVKAKQGCKVCH